MRFRFHRPDRTEDARHRRDMAWRDALRGTNFQKFLTDA